MYIRSELGKDLVMGVKDSSTAAGTPIQSSTLVTGSAAQQWMKEQVGENRFYLVSKLSTDTHPVKLEIKVLIYILYFSCVSLLLLQ